MKRSIPTHGYILPLWKLISNGKHCLQYRATAIAYMERENLKQVTHQNGQNYFLDELKAVVI